MIVNKHDRRRGQFERAAHHFARVDWGVVDGARSLNLVGNALLEYGSGSIRAVEEGGQITLDGPQALIADASDTTSNSALTGFNNNAGVFTLAHGASIGPIERAV